MQPNQAKWSLSKVTPLKSCNQRRQYINCKALLLRRGKPRNGELATHWKERGVWGPEGERIGSVLKVKSIARSRYLRTGEDSIYCMQGWQALIFRIFSLNFVLVLKVTFSYSLLLFSHSAVCDSLRPHGCSKPSFHVLMLTVSWGLIKLMAIESEMPSSHLILCPPLHLLPSIFSSFRIFSNELALHIRWRKYWSFTFSISPFNECPGLISFRIDWFDLLVVQGTLKSLLQHHSSKASILGCSAFFMVQLTYPYMTTGKTMALTTWMSLLFNMLSRFVIAFLPRSKRLLISRLQSLSAVIFGAQENKICHDFHFLPTYLPWSDGTRCHDLSFLNVEF